MLKYRNRTFTNKYGSWDSQKEFQHYLLLLNRLKRHEISDLHRQVKYILIPAQYETEIIQLKTKTKEKQICVEKECAYYADFTYMEQGKLVVEDVKSEITRKNSEYIIKRKLMLHVHGVKITEV